MIKSLSVPASLGELLKVFMLKNQIDQPEIVKKISFFKGQQRIPMAVWWDLIHGIQEVHPIPALGVHIGRLIEPYHIGVLGYLALSSPNLISFLACFQKLQPLLQNSSKLTAHMVDDQLCLTWNPIAIWQPPLSNEVLITGFLKMAQAVTDRFDIKPLLVEFPAPSAHDPALYEELFECPVRFESDRLRLWLPMALLTVPINGSDPHLKFLLDQQAEALLLALPNSDPFLSEVQLAIVDVLKEGEPSAEKVAQKLNCSLRTLYRRIDERDLQYSQLLSKTRFELARKYLADPQLSLPEIALLLGYSEQSAFSRAFRTWANCSPSEFRRNSILEK